jgi:EAL domain-containing protein (putative c-di-GMP-specific phosphodiesterase class I)
MLESGAVEPFFQRVIRLGDGATLGYELLGRAKQFGVICQPRELFEIAGSLKAEEDLSRLFRLKGMEATGTFAQGSTFFLNVHPAEMKDLNRLVQSLRDLKHLYPDRQFCVEVGERVVTNPGEIRMLRDSLHADGIGLAYDDFGAGRARLVELAEVPPDYLKFDMGLVQNLHRASSGRQNMVRMLVELATRQGVQSIAEGIENKDDADLCLEYGFFAAQGFFFGKPYAPGAPSQDTLYD